MGETPSPPSGASDCLPRHVGPQCQRPSGGGGLDGGHGPTRASQCGARTRLRQHMVVWPLTDSGRCSPGPNRTAIPDAGYNTRGAGPGRSIIIGNPCFRLKVLPETLPIKNVTPKDRAKLLK